MKTSDQSGRMQILPDCICTAGMYVLLQAVRGFIDRADTHCRTVICVRTLTDRDTAAGTASTFGSLALSIAVEPMERAEADSVLLKQVWMNLLSNALKFTGQCEMARIEIGSFESEGQTVYFVKDNGAGFDKAYAERLFRAFQRFHHAEEFPGNGLGLAIVDRIIRHHGGRAWAQAEVDKGAAFYFHL